MVAEYQGQSDVSSFGALLLLIAFYTFLVLRRETVKERKYYSQFKGIDDSDEKSSTLHPVELSTGGRAPVVSDPMHPDVYRYGKLMKEKQDELKKKAESEESKDPSM